MVGCRTGWIGVGLVVLALLAPAAGWSQTENDVLEGGFRLFDPDVPRGREADVLSLGPLVLGGARARTSPPDFVSGECTQMLFAMLGNESSKRKETGVRVSQKDHVVVFFVFADCIGEDEQCILGASDPVAVEGCSGSIQVTEKRGAFSGKSKVRCKGGIDASDPDFGMSMQEQNWVKDAFPELGEGFELKFKAGSVEQVTGIELAMKVMNLDPDAIDDPVATYLLDDGLPTCP